MKKSLFYLFGILMLSFLLDSYTTKIIPKIQFDYLTSFMAYFTIIGCGYGVLILITIIVGCKKKELLFRSWFSLGLAMLIAWIIKNLIMRVRPELGLIAETGFSFPSGHAAAVFSVYPLLREKFRNFSSYWLVFAILILFSRLYLNVHYLSDVIGGALVGLIAGSFVISKHFKVIKDKYFKFLK